MTVGSEVREVEAGDAVFIPRGHTHPLENTGQTSMTILLVCACLGFEDHHAEENKIKN